MLLFCTYNLSLFSLRFVFYLPLSLFQGLQGIRAAQPRWTRTLTVATRMPAVAISAARTWASLSWGCSTRSLVLAPAPCWGMPGLRAKLQPRYWQRLHVEHIVVVKQRIIVWRALCNMLVQPPSQMCSIWVRSFDCKTHSTWFTSISYLSKRSVTPSCPMGAVFSFFSTHPTRTGCSAWWFLSDNTAEMTSG